MGCSLGDPNPIVRGSMLLAIDIGNTNIVFGIFKGKTLKISWRLTTWPDRTADELWVVLSHLFSGEGLNIDEIDGVIVASVVPPLTQIVTEMVTHRFGCKTLCVDAGNSGLTIQYENPDEVGADRLVNGVAAFELYSAGSRPVMVADFGTATTFDVISPRREYLGGVICPGVEISADALFQRAARLPRVELRRPSSVIGRTTVASMQSGLFFGHVAMVEGIVTRLCEALPAAERPVCIGTGGLAEAIAVETKAIDHVNGDLTLVGLQLVWELNTQPQTA